MGKRWVEGEDEGGGGGGGGYLLVLYSKSHAKTQLAIFIFILSPCVS